VSSHDNIYQIANQPYRVTKKEMYRQRSCHKYIARGRVTSTSPEVVSQVHRQQVRGGNLTTKIFTFGQKRKNTHRCVSQNFDIKRGPVKSCFLVFYCQRNYFPYSVLLSQFFFLSCFLLKILISLMGRRVPVKSSRNSCGFTLFRVTDTRAEFHFGWVYTF